MDSLTARPVPSIFRRLPGGAVAQLGERLVRNEEVRGSIPLSSTTRSLPPWVVFVLPPEKYPLQLY